MVSLIPGTYSDHLSYSYIVYIVLVGTLMQLA